MANGELYMQMVYDLNELAKLAGKDGEKLFTRIVVNLDKICGYDKPVKKNPQKK